MLRVFLDANVYFAGFLSEEGASSFVLELARKKKIILCASRLVLREADRNLRKKAPPKILKAFRRFLQQTKISIAPPPADMILESCEAYIHPKDVPVLAAVLEAKIDFLITLDRRHFFTPKVLSFSKKIKIVTPAEFLHELSKRK